MRPWQVLQRRQLRARTRITASLPYKSHLASRLEILHNLPQSPTTDPLRRRPHRESLRPPIQIHCRAHPLTSSAAHTHASTSLPGPIQITTRLPYNHYQAPINHYRLIQITTRLPCKSLPGSHTNHCRLPYKSLPASHTDHWALVPFLRPPLLSPSLLYGTLLCMGG